jgi:hypothetical protein
MAEVASDFAPKQPPPKEVIALKVIQHFVDFLERPSGHVGNLKTYYDHSINKSYMEMKRKRSGKIVPQLEE